MPKPLPPIQSEIEAAQRDLFRTGDIKAVAAHLGYDQSYISHLLSPEKPDNKSPLYVFERFVYACDQERVDLGDGHVAMFLTDRARWLPLQDGGERIPQAVPDSMFAYLQAAIAKLPPDVQMRLLDKTYIEIDKFKRGQSDLDDKVENIKARRK